MNEFGAPLAGLTPEDFMQSGYYYQMGNPPLRVDIMMSIPGIDFESAWERRTLFRLDSLSVPFISREDLIRSKRAAGRPQDLNDLSLLKA